jgi:Zn-dependent M28 family amino/carboxypeptidase
VSLTALEQTVRTLAAFETRNTLSPLHRKAAGWIGDAMSDTGLEVEQMTYTLPVGKRVTEPVEAFQVLGRRHGNSDRWVVVSAHFDSLNLSVDQATGRAPGANDNATGVALILEVARMCPTETTECGLLVAALSGEEQGLCGARALAERLANQGTRIAAVLNFDTVGGSENSRGTKRKNDIRLFGDAGPSRELARWITFLQNRREIAFRAKLVLRKDRFGRGGDHTPMQQAGFPAIRFTESVEEYERQHTDQDLPEFVDFDYLRNVLDLSVHATRTLLNAPASPAVLRCERSQGHDTSLDWDGADPVTILWRETDSAYWQYSRQAQGGGIVLRDVSIDDHIFGVTRGGVPTVQE